MLSYRWKERKGNSFQSTLKFPSRFQIFTRKEVRKMEMERQILVALVAQRIKDAIRDFGRSHGEILKSAGANVKEAQLLILDVAEEAVALLKTKAQQLEKK